MVIVPPWVAVVLPKEAVAGVNPDAVKLPPKSCGYPPVKVTTAVPFVQLGTIVF
jgi:hypothetical protein